MFDIWLIYMMMIDDYQRSWYIWLTQNGTKIQKKKKIVICCVKPDAKVIVDISTLESFSILW